MRSRWIDYEVIMEQSLSILFFFSTIAIAVVCMIAVGHITEEGWAWDLSMPIFGALPLAVVWLAARRS